MLKDKDEFVLRTEERQNQTEEYINFLKSELQEKTYFPIVKQKVGTIMKIKKVYY